MESLLYVNDLVLFNGLQNFKQVMTICNSYHQKKLLKESQYDCSFYFDDTTNTTNTNSNAHYYNYMNNQFNCSIGHKVIFSEHDAGFYDYLGFISEEKPAGRIDFE